LSVIKFSTPIGFAFDSEAWIVERAGPSPGRLLSNAFAELTLVRFGHQCDNHVALLARIEVPHTMVFGQLYINLTSNQVGLPAELKHINKRRKRN
jgi:hypothetical protein